MRKIWYGAPTFSMTMSEEHTPFTVSPRNVVETFNVHNGLPLGIHAWDNHAQLYETLIATPNHAGTPTLTAAQYANANSGGRTHDSSKYTLKHQHAKKHLQGTFTDPIQALERLHSSGFFTGHPRHIGGFDLNALGNFDPTNKYFEFVTLIMSTSFWSGSISQRNENGKTRTGASFRFLDKKLSDEQKIIFQPLYEKAISLELIQPQSTTNVSNGSTTLSIFRASISRLISKLMGIVGSKRKADLFFPEYVMDAFHIVADGGENHQHAHLARKILADFIAIGLSAKGGYLSNYNQYKLSLFPSNSNDVANARIGAYIQLCSAVNFCTVEEIRSYTYERDIRSKETSVFDATIRMPSKAVREMQATAAARIQEVVGALS